MNKLLSILLLLFLWVSVPHAAVTVGTITTANQVDSFSATIDASANGALICIGQVAAGVGTPSNVTVGGQAVTAQLTNATTPDAGQRMTIFWKAAPLTGSQTVAYTQGSGSPWLATAVIPLIGVSQTTPTNLASGGEDEDTSVSRTVNSAVGDLLVDCVMHSQTETTNTPGAGQAQIFDFNHNSSIVMFGSTEAGASPNVVMSWTLSDIRWHAEGAVSLAPLVSARRRVIYDYR